MAHEILDFNANIGGWRCSKNCDIVTTSNPIMQFKQTGTERKIVCESVMVKNKEINIETEKDIPTFGNVQVGEDIELTIIPNTEICFPQSITI